MRQRMHQFMTDDLVDAVGGFGVDEDNVGLLPEVETAVAARVA